jgi:hypothetical protein
MVIRELNSDKKFVTITLDYDECRCLCNSMYQLSIIDTVDRENNFDSVYAKTIELFSLVKHGKIPAFELKQIYNLLTTDNK